MKNYRRHNPFGEFIAPVAFDYTLLSHLYIHKDGNDIIDFTGKATTEKEINTFLDNKSVCGEVEEAATLPANAADEQGMYVHMQVHDEEAQVPRKRFSSRLVRTVDRVGHLWMVSQPTPQESPFARIFHSAESLFDYIDDHHMQLPARRGMRTQQMLASPTTVTYAVKPMSYQLPSAKWIDLQCKSGDPASAGLVRDVLSRFPVSQDTIDRCLFLALHDYVDTDHLSSDNSNYLFFLLTCTPIHTNDTTSQSPFAPMAAGGHANNTTAASESFYEAKSVMQMRFEAVRDGLPRRSVPDPVPVAVIVFADWVITIHDKPFAEMDDLFRIIKFRCSPPATHDGGEVSGEVVPHSYSERSCQMQEKFSTSFFFASLIQIAVGHHLDSVTLAEALNELGDIVFHIKKREKDQLRIVHYITALRRCFGECGADVNRREGVVSALLQPQLAHNVILREPSTRRLLESALAYLRTIQDDLDDCRDTVSLSNWYHNVALHWTLLRRGNQALRMLIILTEMCNILYPVVIVQTLYSMNVRLPYQAADDPPNTTLAPFFIVAGIIFLYSLWCVPALIRTFVRRPFKTKLLL